MLFWPGIWLHGAYMYPYYHPYSFYNQSSGRNETKPVQCACDPTVECGCDDDNSTTTLNELVGDGDYNKLNKSVITVADYNGTNTILINGTLPNGTTASGGDEDATSSATRGLRYMVEAAGWWPVVATVGALVWAA
jgi:hypothetical protein